MRKKQLIYLGTFLIVIYIIIQSLFIYNSYMRVRNELENNAIMLSKIVASNINLTDYQIIANDKIKYTNYYRLQQMLKDIKNVSGAKYIYIERKINNEEIEYIIDADSDKLGEKDKNDDNESFATTKSTSIGTNSKWGELITGFTPILDENKNVIGLVGIDYEIGTDVIGIKNALLDSLRNIIIMTLLILSFIGTLYSFNKSKYRDVMNIYGDIVNSLTIILSKNSDYTWKHSENVSILAEVLAHKFYKNENKIRTIRWASMLHDIGKIGISTEILDKKGKLTEEEFLEIKKHPTHSKEMLEKIFPKKNSVFSDYEITIISDIAKHHHERWDGKGYPSGLKGEGIPFMARIVSLTDAYEAMTAERPYKKPMSKEHAIEQIINCSGTQFDPHIVEKFLECVKEGDFEYGIDGKIEYIKR